jgi:hypothetical protein
VTLPEEPDELQDKIKVATLELWSGVALRQFEQGEEQITELRLREMVQNELERLVSEEPRDEPQQIDATSLIEGAKRDGLLIATGPDDADPLLFLHRTFQEYLAAKALASQANCAGWASVAGRIDRWSWHPRWEPVIWLLAGQLDDPAPLLELLANESTDDVFRHRLALAALCLGEISNDKRTQHPKIVARVGSEAFALWLYHAGEPVEGSEHSSRIRRDVDQLAQPDQLPRLGVKFHSRILPSLARVQARCQGLTILEWLAHKPAV